MKKELILLFVFGTLLFVLLGSVSAFQLNRTGIVRESSLNLVHENNYSHLSSSDNSLVLYLPFDSREDTQNKTHDYSVDKYSGDVGNGTFWNSSGGIYGGDYYFDGVDDYIGLGDQDNLNVGDSQSYTFSMWVKTPSGSSDYQTLISKGDTNSNGIKILTGNLDNNCYVYFRYDNTYRTGGLISLTKNLRDGLWHNFVVVLDRTDNIRTYIDGVNTGNYSLGLLGNYSVGNGYPFYIGYSPSNSRFNGSIDEVSIFNRSLSNIEIQKIYNSTYSRFYSSGEMNFTNINLSSQENITFEDCQTINGSYIQGRLNSENWQNFTNCEYNTTGFSGDWSSVNFSVRLVSNLDNFYSPLIQGPKNNFLNGFSFAKIANVTFPPVNYSDNCYGANCNTNDEPIGGFTNYSRIVNPDDATYYVNTNSELLSAISKLNPGEVIYINDSVTLNFSNPIQINVSNVTIASGRGRDYSEGALITSDNYYALFNISSPYVRITGLRFTSLHEDCDYGPWYQIYYSSRDDLSGTYSTIFPTRKGIVSNAPYTEVDNDEIYGWSYSGVLLDDGALNSYVHNNYAHGNCHMGLGYSIDLDGPNSSALVEANLFEHNKHSVAATPSLNSYEARYNIQLNVNDATSHAFDRHGNVTYGGNYTIFHHNTFYSSSNPDGAGQSAISIRAPPNSTDGGQIYNNWFQNDSISINLIQTFDHNVQWVIPTGGAGSNVDIFNNLLNSSGNQYYAEPVAIASLNSTSVSENETILFNASASYSNESTIRYVEWDFADNTSKGYGTSVTHSFTEPGRYKVKVTVSDSAGFLNWTYLNVTVNPINSSKVYLDFWMYERSLVDSPEYVKKVAIVNNETIWEQNFTDNYTGWRHIDIEIPSNLTTNNLANVTLGVKTVKNYTDPLYPNPHSVEYFEVYFDQIAILSGNNDSVGLQGDMDSLGNWKEMASSEDSNWAQNISWERNINGGYSYEISPVYRGNYTAGTFVGINQQFSVTRLASSNSAENSNTNSPSSSGYPLYSPNQNNLQKGYTKTMRENWKVQFKFENQTKQIEVTSVNKTLNKVSVNVNGTDYNLSVNETKKIDLNNDGYYDLQIEVNSIDSYENANMTFTEIHEEISSQQSEEQTGNVVDNSGESSNTFWSSIGNFFKKLWDWITFWN